MISDNDDGLRWFKYCYEMLPWQVDYGYGGGNVLEMRETQPDGSTKVSEITAEMLAAHLLAEGCTTVVIDSVDDAFRQRYAGLFADDLAAYDAGETQIYNVDAAQGTVRLTPRYPAAWEGDA